MIQVVSITSGKNLGNVALGPLGERCERSSERPAKFREFVLNSGRYFRKDLAGQKPITLHGSQRCGKNLWSHSADTPLDLSETKTSILECEQHEHGPLITDPIQHGSGGAGGVEGVTNSHSILRVARSPCGYQFLIASFMWASYVTHSGDINMDILLIGATGMIGKEIATEATRRGHRVTPVSRSGGEGIETADATDTTRITTLASGHDAVVMATNPPHDVTDGTTLFLAAGTSVIEATRAAGVRRLVFVGGAGSLLLPDGERVIDAAWFPAEFKAVAQAHVELLKLIRRDATDLEWTYISPPPMIQPGERTGTYTSGHDDVVADADGVSTISVEDYAIALVDELEQNNNVGRRMTVANT